MSTLLFITATRIGDAVLSTGVLDRMVSQSPGLRVTVACGPVAAPLFEGVPGLERIIVMNKRGDGGHWWDLWRACVLRRWDMVIDLRRSALAWLLRARERRVLGRVDDTLHKVRANASVLGLSHDPPSPRLWTLPRHEQAAHRLIPDGARVLAVAPCANWRAKTWRAERFAELIARLTAPEGILPEARIAVFAAAEERAQAEPLLESLPSDRVLDLIGGQDLLTTQAALARCAFFVGNDSGLMHMAAAAGAPTLGLFGPSRDEHYAPWGANTAFVRTRTPFAELFPPGFDHRTSGTLMDGLDVDTVEQAARALWRRSREGRP